MERRPVAQATAPFLDSTNQGYEAAHPRRYAIVHSADIQDRDGGALLMASLFGAFRS
jgi:hypothetical protein